MALLLAVGVPVLGLALLSALSRKPDNLGVVNGRLADCPESPNCVCSQASDPAHHIEPFRFDGSPTAALAQLQAVIAAAPGGRLVTAEGWYLHAEFISQLFRFVDDVEFLIDPAAGVIHCRSASRVGRSDLRVNRRRLEELRRSFDAARTPAGQ
ncbi:MAG: DUF1499 domain-containing protein [Planctomycetia bacterium]|nr:DUF1499 domain-containing protein [Planctomycetia bacterium]